MSPTGTTNPTAYDTPPFACPHNCGDGSCHYPYCIRPAHSAWSSKCEVAQVNAIDKWKENLRKDAAERLVGAAAGEPYNRNHELRLQNTTGPTEPLDPVHPPHYKQHPSGVECIDIIEHLTFNVGTAVKYLWRAGNKAGESATTDLRKAIWYIEREIKRAGRDVRS